MSLPFWFTWFLSSVKIIRVLILVICYIVRMLRGIQSRLCFSGDTVKLALIEDTVAFLVHPGHPQEMVPRFLCLEVYSGKRECFVQSLRELEEPLSSCGRSNPPSKWGTQVGDKHQLLWPLLLCSKLFSDCSEGHSGSSLHVLQTESAQYLTLMFCMFASLLVSHWWFPGSRLTLESLSQGLL